MNSKPKKPSQNQIGEGFFHLIGARCLLNEIDAALFPRQIVTPDGRTFNVKGNNLMDNDRPQNMRMEGDKNGDGVEKKPQKNKQHQLDHAIDEHDLKKMNETDRTAFFKRDADRGIHRGQRIRTEDKSLDLELDRVNVENKVIVEDKRAKGFEKNPKGIDTAIEEWVENNIYENVEKKVKYIDDIGHHIYYNNKDVTSSPYLPDISDVKSIKHIIYKVKCDRKSYDGKLDQAINATINRLKKKYPNWKIDIEYKK